jgi:hypothetical protein
MRKVLALAAAVLALPSLARAGDVELTGFAGYTFPFYSQTFDYSPGPVTVPIPGVSVEQSGSFQLKASGGTAFGGSLAFFPAATIGFELRVDHGNVKVETLTTGYNVNVTLPAPFDPVKTTLDLSPGQATLDAAAPWSLNLKLRTSGRSGFYISGGLSHLGDLNFSATQTVALGVVAVNLVTSNLEIATIEMRTKPRTAGSSSWGGNLGLGLQFALGEHGRLLFEGRGFYFAKQTYDWEAVITTPLPPLQTQLLGRLQLDPIEVKPWWVQATVGISYRF